MPSTKSFRDQCYRGKIQGNRPSHYSKNNSMHSVLAIYIFQILFKSLILKIFLLIISLIFWANVKVNG